MTLRLLIVAGETSGDRHAAELLRALSARVEIDAVGIGGEELRKAGCNLFHHVSSMHVTGFLEVVRRYPFFRRTLHQTAAEAIARNVDGAILVDYPGFNLRLADLLHARGIPVYYYIAPQTWAWKEKRVARLRRAVRRLIVILPFEVDYFRSHGIDAFYAGNPTTWKIHNEMESRPSTIHRTDARKIIAYLPGSRPNEIQRHLPIVVEVIRTLGESGYRHIIAKAPHLSDAEYRSAGMDDDIETTTDTLSLLRTADAGIIKSGTSTLEAAAVRLPFVTIYRTSTLSYLLGKTLALTTYLSMPNILSGQRVVPELLQDDCTPQRIIEELTSLFMDDVRIRQLDAFDRINRDLDRGDPFPATAAMIVEDLSQ